MLEGKYQVLLEWDPDEAVWVTYVPALDYLSTYGETREESLANTREAILGYVEAAEHEGIAIPSTPTVELIQLDIAV
ncbi:MAG: type II toxin-antitoxin system HicB family antitoxin [Thermomicrobiales bacterium]